MFKQSFKIIFFICTIYLYLTPQISLAEENILNNSVTEPNDSYVDESVDKPVQLKISIGKRQVTLYQGENIIKSYPIAVGRKGWETPTGYFRVRDMLVKPTWINPKTGKSIPGGDPENPLGNYWIGFWTNGKDWVGFHGTPNPESVGKAVSHGCIRMYNKDVEELFNQVSIGTPVTVTQ